MKVLITGASGGLGKYVVRELCGRGFDPLVPSHTMLDICNYESIHNYFNSNAPEAIIHLAAFANVDECSKQPEYTSLFNVLGTQWLSEKSKGIPFIYMSTNDVFSECSNGPFDESRTPAPGMTYSWSKLCGEQSVITAGGGVIRANFFTRQCNAKKSFVDYVISSAQSGAPFACYTNVVSNPVFAGTLAHIIVNSLLAELKGVLHVATLDEVNRAQQARMICEAYGLPTTGIIEKQLENRNGRPLDARLVSNKYKPIETVESEIAKLVVAEPL